MPHAVEDNNSPFRNFTGTPRFVAVKNFIDMRPPNDAVTGSNHFNFKPAESFKRSLSLLAEGH